MPVLENLNVQALFYITTSILNTNDEIWWDRLDNIFFGRNELPRQLKIHSNRETHFFNLTSGKEISSAYSAIHRLLKSKKQEIRNKIIDGLFADTGISSSGRESHRFMSFEELKRMGQSKSAIIGAHTHTHTPLSILSFEEQFEDIKKSKDILEGLLKTRINSFSYPFGGRKDYNSDSIKASALMGFDFVCANYYWQLHKWTNRLELPRALVRNWELKTFKSNIEKFFKY